MSWFWPTRNTPAPIPPTKRNNPKIVAITFPPANFFFGVEVVVTAGITISSAGAADPEFSCGIGGRASSVKIIGGAVVVCCLLSLGI